MVAPTLGFERHCRQPRIVSFCILCLGAPISYALTTVPSTVRRLQQQKPSMRTYASRAERLYTPHRKYPDLFGNKFLESWLAPEFLELVQSVSAASVNAEKQNSTDVIQSLPHLRKETTGVYSFPCLSKEFLSVFNEELQHFYNVCKSENIPVRRPNSMNNYGVIVNDIGMQSMITDLQQTYLWPLAKELFPVHGEEFDDHHSFLVRYQADEDLGLDMHIDDSDVTFNVCLGDANFTGATLVFCGMFGEPDHRHVSHTYHHVIGRGILHLGSRRHGAEDIASGTRTNLIVWSHNWKYRSSPEYRNRQKPAVYSKESGPPDLQCLSFTHDRDYTHFKALTEKQRQQDLHPWCPPIGKEYGNYGQPKTASESEQEPRSQDEL